MSRKRARPIEWGTPKSKPNVIIGGWGEREGAVVLTAWPDGSLSVSYGDDEHITLPRGHTLADLFAGEVLLRAAMKGESR